MKFLLLLLFCLPLTNILAQNFTTKKTASKKALKYYDKGLDLARTENYTAAIEQLDKALKVEPTFIDALIFKSSAQTFVNQKTQAEKGFETVLLWSDTYSPKVYYELALLEVDLQKYEEAAQHFQAYIDKGKSKKRKTKAKKHLVNAQFAATAVKNPKPYTPTPLSPAINTEEHQYLPSFSADGKKMIYTARRQRQEDLMESTFKDGEWQAGQPLEDINTPDNDGAQTISADGKLLVFTRCASQAGMGGCELFYAKKVNKKWTTPKKIKAVNTSAWEAQPSLSANGKWLYFASDREGGKGGRDIWKSQRIGPDQWSAPVNLGDSINTPANDQCPFIHPDGQTLYFCSEGLPGMGGIDLYFARKNAHGEWQTPTNLGYPINTAANEGTLVVSLDGKTAYFATDKIANATRENMNIDIYRFDLYPEAQPQAVSYIEMSIVDSRTKYPISASVNIHAIDDNNTFWESSTDKTGKTLLCLPAGKDYALHIEKEGYLFHSEHFALTDTKTIQTAYELKIALSPIPEKAVADIPTKTSIRLNNIFFDSGSADLLPQSNNEIQRIVKLLQQQTQLNIRIDGHTDNVGNEANNLALSEQRAKAVYNALIEKGIKENRLSFKGFGESQPIAPNDTSMGKQKNRRTEMTILH